MANWIMLDESIARPSRIKGARAVFAPYTSDDGIEYAVVQPGHALMPYTDPVTGHEGSVPTEHPSIYARRFGNDAGPEWEVNGKPYADSWTVSRERNRDGSYLVRAGAGIAHTLTPAAYRVISEWLTSDDVVAALFDPTGLAKSAVDSTATRLKYARDDFDKARALWEAAEHAAADARHALRLLSE